MRVTLIVLGVVLAFALVIGALFDLAATHYEGGVYALKVHWYAWAANEFSAARVLVFPYRDAQSLEDQARRAFVNEEASRGQAAARRAAVVAKLEKAGARLEAGDAHGVLAALLAINGDDLRATLDGSEKVRESANALAVDLTAAARRALGKAAWGRAERFAAALLVLEPSSERAVALGARARTGENLEARLGKAKAAARRGKWREALRLARGVLAVQKDFPGAAAVVADARDALAPEPEPAATQPAQATGGSPPTTAPEPPPP